MLFIFDVWFRTYLVALLHYSRHHFLRSFLYWSSYISLTYSSSHIRWLFISLTHSYFDINQILYNDFYRWGGKLVSLMWSMRWFYIFVFVSDYLSVVGADLFAVSLWDTDSYVTRGFSVVAALFWEIGSCSLASATAGFATSL